MAQASWERLAEIKSGRTSFQQGLAAPAKTSGDECGYRNSDEGAGLAHELVGAGKKG
jgi:hypothetical protein